MSYFPEVIPEYRVNLDNELDVEVFVNEYGFYKIVKSKIKPEKAFIKSSEASPIEYDLVSPNLKGAYKKYRELIYLICINGKIAKIGATKTGMYGRLKSYNAGAKKARDKGTCSVTNYDINQAQYAALCDGKTVEWYMYEVPYVPYVIPIFGILQDAKPITAYTYESQLLEIYKNLTGHYPPLSKNSGVR